MHFAADAENALLAQSLLERNADANLQDEVWCMSGCMDERPSECTIPTTKTNILIYNRIIATVYFYTTLVRWTSCRVC